MSERSIDGLKHDLWRHQQDAFDFVAEMWEMDDGGRPRSADGAMLAMGMGTGKTFTTIALAVASGVQRMLVVCPKKVVAVWPAEFAKHCDLPFLICAPTKGTLAERAAEMRRAAVDAETQGLPFVGVVNYDAFWQPPFGPTMLDRRQGFRRGNIVDQGLLIDLHYQLVVYDEVHRIKSPTGVTSKMARWLSDRVPFRLGLTGTPMPQNPLDIWAQMRALDKSAYGDNWPGFQQQYLDVDGSVTGRPGGIKNADKLNRIFWRKTFRVGDEVLDLPEYHHVVRTTELSPKGRAVYNRLSSEFSAQIDSGSVTAANSLVRVLRLQQLTSGFLILDEESVDAERAKKAGAAPVRDVRRRVEVGATEETLTTSGVPEMLLGSSAEGTTGLLFGGVPAPIGGAGVLLDALAACESARGSGACESATGVRQGTLEEQLWLRNDEAKWEAGLRASRSDGGSAKKTVKVVRTGASQERRARRQPAGESRALGQTPAGGATGRGLAGLDGEALSIRDSGTHYEGRCVTIDTAKEDLLADVLEDIDPREPVVIFCLFHYDMDVVHRVAKKLGRRSLELSGRRDDLGAWQHGAAPLLAAQYEAGGEGVDLTRAHRVIYYAKSWKLGKYDQSLKRSHRPGQTHPVTYIHLRVEDSVDETVDAALADRGDVVKAVIERHRGAVHEAVA